MRASVTCRVRYSKDCSRTSRRCRRSPKRSMSVAATPKSRATAMEHLSRELLDSYLGDERARRIARRYLPSREAIAEILQGVLDLMYPGYFGRGDLDRANLAAYVAESLAALAPKIEREMEHCLCYGREHDAGRSEGAQSGFGECASRSRELTEVFLGRLPEIRALLVRDVQAAYDGDPAASNLDEVILAYPGGLAVSVYRIAKIGAGFFIDHATGVVIGETTDIGEGVKLYQGVTLGALSLPKDSNGQIIRGNKRHPTVEHGSTLYANATVLGGKTVVGAESGIGGAGFLAPTIP